MQKRTKIVLAAFAAMVAGFGTPAFASELACRDSRTHYAAEALAEVAASGELPGAIAVYVYRDLQEVSLIGYADVAAKRPMTLDSMFMQCSQTKGFCGVTVAKLVEEGKLSLDDPVSRYLPEFATLWVKRENPDGTITLSKAKNVLTVRMCLNHTGGFPFEIPAKNHTVPGGGWSGGMPIRSVAATAAAQPLQFEPGTKDLYSNTGIDIGAAVVETVTGKKWEAYLQETVLDPLGMKDTCFKPTEEQLSRMVEMYRIGKGRPAERMVQNNWEQRPYNGDHVFPSAGAGLWTTASDQLKFYKMLMNLGLGENGVRILKEETVKNLLAVSTRPQGMGGYSLGLGAPVKDGEDEWFGHGGAWGTNCMVNWHKRQLKLWVVQNGDRIPDTEYPNWGELRNQAEAKFFKTAAELSSGDEYTGRIGDNK